MRTLTPFLQALRAGKGTIETKRAVFLAAVIATLITATASAATWEVYHEHPNGNSYIDTSSIIENPDESKTVWTKAVLTVPSCSKGKCTKELLQNEQYYKNRKWNVFKIILRHTDGTTSTYDLSTGKPVTIPPESITDAGWRFLYPPTRGSDGTS